MKQRRKICISLLCIMLVVALLPFQAFAAAEGSVMGRAENALSDDLPGKYDSYEQFLAYYYIDGGPLDSYLDNDLAPYHQYVNINNDEMKKRVEKWKLATLDADDAVESCVVKEVDFYNFLIFDIMYQEVPENSALNSAKTAVSALQSGLVKDMAEVGYDWTKVKLEEGDEQEIIDKLIEIDCVKDIAGKIGLLKKGLSYTEDAYMLTEKVFRLIQIHNETEDVKEILEYLNNHATDVVMKKACEEMAEIMSNSLSDEEIVGIVGGTYTAGKVSDFVLGKAWDSIVGSSALGQGIAIGKGIGKLASNFLFSTDDLVENWYSMERIYVFEKVLKDCVLQYKRAFESNPTYENAERLNIAANMYLNCISVGMDYSIKYVKAFEKANDGIGGWLYRLFANEKKADYDGVIKTLKSIKGTLDSSIKFANNETYNYYLESLESRGALGIDNWEPTPCDVTEKQIKEELAEHPNWMFMLTDQTTVEDTNYTEPKITYASYTHKSGTLNLNGQTLTVGGDFYLKGGTVDLDGGVLDVSGDFYIESGTLVLDSGTVNVGGTVIQSGGTVSITKGTLNISEDYRIQKIAYDEAGDPYYTKSNGLLTMKNDEDQVNVKGDFVSQEQGNSHVLSAGILAIGGDFTHTNSVRTFWPTDTHKVILNGSDNQTVSFDDAYSKFNQLEIADGASITFKSNIGVVKLLSDVTATAEDLVVGEMNLNGHKVILNGDVRVNGNVNLAKGELTINGDLVQENGEIIVAKGTMNVNGDYRIQRIAYDEAGDPYYTKSNGLLTMKNDEDQVNVKGDFVSQEQDNSHVLSAGVLAIGGDFTHTNSVRTFWPTDTHKVILNGSDNQTVSFDDAYSKFNQLEIADGASITFKSNIGVVKLLSDVTATAEDLVVGEMNLNGHKVTLNGDVRVNGNVNLAKGELTINGNLIQENGVITIAKGVMNVNGDYRLQRIAYDDAGDMYYTAGRGALTMKNDEDRVNVKGDFVSEKASESDTMSAGVLAVGGDFTHIYNHGHYFWPSDTHKVILNGTGNQTVSFDNSSCLFNKLEIAAGSSVTFANHVGIRELMSDVTANAENLSLTEINLNGHKVTLNGDVRINGNVNLAKGELTINGNLIQENGEITIAKGVMNVNGDYRIQCIAYDEAGDMYYTYSYAKLKMDDDADRVNVTGDFIVQQNCEDADMNAGILTVSGDFMDLEGPSYAFGFCPRETHKVVLNGNGPQNVIIENYSSRFNILQLANHRENYTFNREPCWNTLEAPQMTYAVSIEPTMEADGMLHGSCTHCDKVDDVVLPKLNAEAYNVKTIAKATCTEPETLRYQWNVSDYGNFVFEVKTTTIPHDYVDGICKLCQTPEPGCEHEIVIDAAVEATCSATGLTEGQHCSVCNEVLVKQEVVPAKEHSFKDGVCEVCAAKDPDYVAPTVKPTVAPTPTVKPTVEPTAAPTPTVKPTVEPTAAPTPTVKPTVEPTAAPTPTVKPTVEPTAAPHLP